MKSVEEVLSRIEHMIKSVKDTPTSVTLPLQAIDGGDWGYGIYCAKGIWVTECDPTIAKDVLDKFSGINHELL